MLSSSGAGVAEIAQPVERDVANVEVVGSIPTFPLHSKKDALQKVLCPCQGKLNIDTSCYSKAFFGVDCMHPSSSGLGHYPFTVGTPVQIRLGVPFKARIRNHINLLISMIKICPKCQSSHELLGVFCSRTCANGRPKSAETKEKIRLKMVGRVFGKKKDERRTNLICCTCGLALSRSKSQISKRNYCNKKCSDLDHKRAPLSGGFREGSGRSKSGYYKGIYCGSTYELAWVYYMISKGTSFIRFEGYIDIPSGGKYFPDFLVDKKIVEIKGYWTKNVDIKSDAARNAGYDISVLYKKDLAECFEIVRKKIGNKPIESLYEDFKPSYSYVCCICGENFSAQRKRRLSSVCCSKKCGGKFGRSHTLKEKSKLPHYLLGI